MSSQSTAVAPGTLSSRLSAPCWSRAKIRAVSPLSLCVHSVPSGARTSPESSVAAGALTRPSSRTGSCPWQSAGTAGLAGAGGVRTGAGALVAPQPARRARSRIVESLGRMGEPAQDDWCDEIVTPDGTQLKVLHVQVTPDERQPDRRKLRWPARETLPTRITLAGRCPRCKHPMTATHPVAGKRVLGHGGVTLATRCACTYEHAEHPAGEHGCGARFGLRVSWPGKKPSQAVLA